MSLLTYTYYPLTNTGCNDAGKINRNLLDIKTHIDAHTHYQLHTPAGSSAVVEVDATGAVKIGGASNYSQIEPDGTLVFGGDATVWRDIFFPQGTPKLTGTGNPSFVTWNGVFRNFAYAVGDTHDYDPQEFDHMGKVGATTAQLHVHFVSLTNVAATRGIKWQIDFSQANSSTVFPATTTVSAEYTVPANTPVGTHILFNVGNPFTTLSPGSIMTCKLTRIAASGTAPATDPVVLGVHYHYEVDSCGSRSITTK